MDWDLIFALGGGLFVILGLLALSMIHIFMIPKEVLKKDTEDLDKISKETPALENSEHNLSKSD